MKLEWQLVIVALAVIGILGQGQGQTLASTNITTAYFKCMPVIDFTEITFPQFDICNNMLEPTMDCLANLAVEYPSQGPITRLIQSFIKPFCTEEFREVTDLHGRGKGYRFSEEETAILKCLPVINLAEIYSRQFDLCNNMIEPTMNCFTNAVNKYPATFDGNNFPFIQEFANHFCTAEFREEWQRLQNCRQPFYLISQFFNMCNNIFQFEIEQKGTNVMDAMDAIDRFEDCVKSFLRKSCGPQDFVTFDKLLAFLKGIDPDTRGLISAMCLSDDDCDVMFSHCQLGMCRCKEGYSSKRSKTMCAGPGWKDLNAEL